MAWLAGLALLPALMCAVMMGGMALAGVLGWRHTQRAPVDGDTTTATGGDASRTPEDARR
jgi:hypothetical protein